MERNDLIRPHLSSLELRSRPRQENPAPAHVPVENHTGSMATFPLPTMFPATQFHRTANSPGYVPSYPNEASLSIVNTAQVDQSTPYGHPFYITPAPHLLYPPHQYPPLHSYSASSAEGFYVDRALTTRGDLDTYQDQSQYAYYDQGRSAEANPPSRTEAQFNDLHGHPYPTYPVTGNQVPNDAEHAVTTAVNITVADTITHLLSHVIVEHNLRALWTAPNGILFRWAQNIDTQLWKFNQTEEPPVEKGEAKELVKYISKKGMKEFSRFDIFIDCRGRGLFFCLWVVGGGRCQHTTERRAWMRSHIRGHFDYAPYACNRTCSKPQCNERFTGQHLLSKHRTPAKECPHCHKSFSSSNFSRHVQSCTS